MKRILGTIIMISALLTLPMLASAQAGFRGDDNRHINNQRYEQKRSYEDSHHGVTKNNHHQVKHHEERHHKNHHVAAKYKHREHQRPVVVKKKVVHKYETVSVPVYSGPRIVLGFPFVFINLGW